MKQWISWMVAAAASTAAIARAQPLPDVPLDPAPPPDPPPEPPGGADVVQADPPPLRMPVGGEPYTPRREVPRPSDVPPPLFMPHLLTNPTGWVLPAAVLYSRLALDTGGGVSSDSRVGLGDVAEFGVATTDAVRARDDDADTNASRIQPYATASFRLGVQESRLFREQPGIALGFRKSFERNRDGYKTRIAELTLVASKHFGSRFALHAGGAFWDASLEGDVDDDGVANRREVTLHDLNDPRRQLRAFGGLEVRPLPRSQILVDLGWTPEFCYRCAGGDAAKIRLRPVLSWGVRYEVASWMRLESGVRVPDIGDANLLDAQIFGQMTLTSWALRRGVDALK